MAFDKLETLGPIFEILLAEGVSIDDASDAIERLSSALETIATDDLETVMVGPDPAFRNEQTGVSGFLERWGDWLSPFRRFRLEIDEVIDQADQLVVLVRQYAIPIAGSIEIEAGAGAIFTFRDERLARAEFILDRDATLELAGIDPASLQSERS